MNTTHSDLNRFLDEAQQVALQSQQEALQVSESVRDIQARMRVLQAELDRYRIRESRAQEQHEKDLLLVAYWLRRMQEEDAKVTPPTAEPETERTYKILGVWHDPSAYGMVCATIDIGRDRVGPMMTSNPSPQNKGGPEALARDIEKALRAYDLGHNPDVLGPSR